MEDIINLKNAPELIIIDNCSIRLLSFLAKDLMPIVDPTIGLFIAFNLLEINSNKIIDTINSNCAWVIDNDQIWKSKVVKNKEEKTDFKYELKEGPLWTPKYVDLVVQLIDKLGNKYLLKARDKEVFYTY